MLGHKQFQQFQRFKQEQEHPILDQTPIPDVLEPDLEDEEVEIPLNYLVTDDFSTIQMHIVTLRVSRISYSKIH